MKREVNHLIKLLEEGAQMLSLYEASRKPEERWSVELKRLAKELKKIDNPEELKGLLQRNYEELFGAKDTFKEVWISSGNRYVASDFDKANKKLDKYRHRLYLEWKRIKSQLEEENKHALW